jgi:TetR/AcrR family transcriptional regulator, mexJK operon transcriptional repressor
VEPREGTQSARKHKAIVEAATELFLRKGYQDTSMDEIAALAAVGKQTVYKHFSDKERLFSEIILGNIAIAEGFTSAAAGILRDTDDLERDLREVARRYLAAVIQPLVLQLRRLIIGEAERFPELARAYYERVPEHTVTTLGSCFHDLAERGLLQADEPALAASHFAWLVLGQPLNKAMFCGQGAPFSTSELDHLADAAVRVFLAAYAASDSTQMTGQPAAPGRGEAAIASKDRRPRRNPEEDGQFHPGRPDRT